MSLKRVVLLVILIAFAVFVLQNATMVQVRLLFWKAEAPRVLVLLVTFALGLATGALLAWRGRIPDRGDRRQSR